MTTGSMQHSDVQNREWDRQAQLQRKRTDTVVLVRRENGVWVNSKSVDRLARVRTDIYP